MLNDIHSRGTFSQLREKDARIAELTAELDKARAALTAIAGMQFEGAMQVIFDGDYLTLCTRLNDIARNALKEG